MTDNQSQLNVLRYLRANREGSLMAGDTVDRVRFITDSISGRIVFPTVPAIADAAELVLVIPEEQPADSPELQLLLAAAPIDTAAAGSSERWMAYHGEPRFTRWLACAIDSAKFQGEVYGGEVLSRENPLRKAEPALCRILNESPAKLASLCQAIAGVSPREPRAVGVDDLGFDVRARFGVVRIEFPQPAADLEAAQALVHTMLEQPRP
jgi:hypothetical protein